MRRGGGGLSRRRPGGLALGMARRAWGFELKCNVCVELTICVQNGDIVGELCLRSTYGNFSTLTLFSSVSNSTVLVVCSTYKVYCHYMLEVS